MAAAEEALAERGYHNIQLDDVARRAKVSKGTLYLYFKDKEDLLLGMVERVAREHLELEGREPPPEEAGNFHERLRRLILFKILWLRDNYDLFAAISLLKPDLYGKKAAKSIRENFMKSLRNTADLMRAGVRAGALRSHDPMRGALFFVSLLRMTELETAFFPKRGTPEKMRDQIFDLFIRGLGAPS